MINQPGMPEIDAETHNAVSLYGQDAMEDFPVLKAFQQYIDAEQNKARKRLVTLGIFFSVLIGAVIAVFLVLLLNISQRNQELNDRLIDFVMKNRETQQASVVVQPPIQQDNSTILSLTSKIEDMQKKLIESQQSAIEAERIHKAALDAVKAAQIVSPEEKEINRLKSLLEAEKEKNNAEKARKREEELEQYRRKHYPELYDEFPRQSKIHIKRRKYPERKTCWNPCDEDLVDTEDVVNDVLNEKKAISYFESDDDMDEDETPVLKENNSVRAKKGDSPSLSTVNRQQKKEQPTTLQSDKQPKPYSIPIDVKGTKSSWRLP